MPIPLLIPIISAAGGAIVGALSRQPEINRLKKQVKILQAEVARLNKLVNEQDRQINSLKMQVTGLKGQQRLQALGKTKGAVMQQYAFKEFMELCCLQATDHKITEKEQKFFNTYENFLNGIDVKIEDKVYLKEYILSRYPYEIENLELINSEELIKKLEDTKVA